MNYSKNVDFSARLTAQAEAKKALLESFKPKPAVTETNFVSREERKAAEREAVRAARQAEKEASVEHRAKKAEQARLAAVAAEQAALEAKRNERKDRKSLEKMDAQARRAARLSAYARPSSAASVSHEGQEA